MLGESRSIVNSQPLGSAMAAKPTVIASGVELTGAPAMSRAEFLSQLGLPPDARLMGAVGRLVPDQRIKDVIWAADLLKCIRSDVHVLLVGDGPQRERLQRYRSQVRVDDQVHFLGIRPDLRNWLGHLDVLCLARDDLALPQIVLDAMATGVPVVAADSPGAREGIQHEETGRLFPVGDRALLARYVNELLDDPVLARRLANAARQRVAADFSPAEMVRRYAEVYRVVAGKE
jgi:glycosyltransferase involved in cell wall biosynthesis